MEKYCIFCSVIFSDTTKNLNRLICSSENCLKQRSRLYDQKRNKDQKKKNSAVFNLKNPGYLQKWRKQNLQKVRESARLNAAFQYRNNINFKLSLLLRHRLYQALKNQAKIGSHIDFLGCSIEELRSHLESKFKPGMTWKNYGIKGWHVDHITAISKFDLSNLEELKKACSYKNLQPLWAKENLKKGSK